MALRSAQWIESQNTSWTREDLHLILDVGGTQYLFEKLVSNGEVEAPAAMTLRHSSRIPRRRTQPFEQGLSLLSPSVSSESPIGKVALRCTKTVS